MKALIFLSLLTLLCSCQDAMRTRAPVEAKKNTESLNSFDREHLIAQINVDFRATNGQIEILENDEDGEESCQLALHAGNIFNYKIVGDVFTLYIQGSSIKYNRISSGAGLVGVWINTRNSGLLDIEEKLSFGSNGELIIRKDCKK